MPKEPEVSIMKALVSLYESGLHYVGFVFLAITGGIVNYIGRLRRGEIVFKPSHLLADVIISGFAGLLVALLAVSFELKAELVFFLAGISGHLGTRAIFLMQEAVIEKAKSVTSDKKE